jgi:hypothetical protein
VLIGAVVLVLAAALAAGAYYARGLVTQAATLPALPPEPKLDVGAPPEPVPSHTDAEINMLMTAPRLGPAAESR